MYQDSFIHNILKKIKMYMGYQFISTVNRQREKKRFVLEQLKNRLGKKLQEYTYQFF